MNNIIHLYNQGLIIGEQVVLQLAKTANNKSLKNKKSVIVQQVVGQMADKKQLPSDKEFKEQLNRMEYNYE
jgi:hypothetical protein